MDKKKLLIKYSIFILVYALFRNILQPYGMRLYYSMHPEPELVTMTVQTIQSMLTATTFLVNLILVIFVIIDSKQKKALDWIIAVIVFFEPTTGLVLFLVWQLYKEYLNKYKAQHFV